MFSAGGVWKIKLDERQRVPSPITLVGHAESPIRKRQVILAESREFLEAVVRQIGLAQVLVEK